MSAKPSKSNLGFFTVWLTGWSVGVASIQWGVLSSLGTESFFMWIFVFSHGGSQIGVMRMITNSLISESQYPGPITTQRTLDEQVLRYPLGSSKYFKAVHSVILAVVVYCILAAPIVWTLADWNPSTQFLSGAFAILFACIWVYTMTWWLKAYRAQIRGLTHVTIRSTAHRIVIQEDRPGPDAPSLTFDTSVVTMTHSDGQLTFEQGDKYWSQAIAEDTEHSLHSLRETIQKAKTDQSNTMEVPMALRELQGKATEPS